MHEPLDCHPANDAQRADAFRNVHDVWSFGLSPEAHLARRLGSVVHRRARWFVGTLAGQVVTALGCHPLQLRIRGQRLPAAGIASVHTLAEFRGRGFAPRLIAWVEDLLRSEGTCVTLLYSDVPPAYYQRLGYTLCPAWEGWRDAAAAPPVSPSDLSPPRFDDWQLLPCDPRRELDRIQHLYQRDHAATGLAIEHDADYLCHLLERRPADEFYWLLHTLAEPLAYVRLTPAEATWKISDLSCTSPADTPHEAALYALASRLAHQRGANRLGGWMRDTPTARLWFNFQPRTKEITMLKALRPLAPLAHNTTWPAELISAAGQFVEIDHV